MSVRLELAEYDGKSVDILKGIRDRHEPTPELMTELLASSAVDDANVQAGATWLLRAYLERGAALTEAQAHTLASALDHITSHWARLHVCQSVRYLDVSRADADVIAAFLRECASADNTFLRAWSTDGFAHLARTHARYAAEASRLLEEALADPAASVRARARRIVDAG